MKKIVTFVTGAFILALNTLAIVHTVNSDIGMAADFTNLQAAADAATDGDTLYVQPALNPYGNLSINKQLTVIGGGHNPEYSPYVSQIGSVTFTYNSSNSVLKGINMNQFFFTGSQLVSNNGIVSGCYISAQNPFNFVYPDMTMNNWIFEGNIILTQSNGINTSEFGANLVFRNNVLHCWAGGSIVTNVPSGTVFDHNLFLITDNTNMGGTITSSNPNITISNSIIYINTTSQGAINQSCAGCAWDNNITYNPYGAMPDLPGTENENNTNPQFVSVPDLSGWYSYSNDYGLQDISVGKNEASDGTDIGLFGGAFNFSPSGFDAGTPRIGTFTLLTGSAPAGGTITIHLKAHGSGQ